MVTYRQNVIANKDVQPLEYYDVKHNVKAHVRTFLLSDMMMFFDSDHTADLRDCKFIKDFVFMV